MINSRKYLFLSILMFLIGVILLQFLQLTHICQHIGIGDDLRVRKTFFVNPRVSNGMTFFSHQTFFITLPDEKRSKVPFADQLAGKTFVIEAKVSQVTRGAEVFSPGSSFPQESQSPGTNSIYSTQKSRISSKLIRMIDHLYCQIQLDGSAIFEAEDREKWGFFAFGKIFHFIAIVQESLLKQFTTYLSEPNDSLAAGVLLGVNRQLPDHFKEALIGTGLLHTIAASGYNISIIAGLMFHTSKRISGIKAATAISLLGIIGYVLLAGLSPAIIRAGIMGSIALFAQVSGRPYLARLGLLWSVVLMLLFSPTLIWNASFQISVSATVGLLWVLPTIQAGIQSIQVFQHRKFHPILLDFGSSFLTTTAASLATLPIIVVRFGRLSLMSFVANTFLLWIIPYIMAVGAVFLLLSWLPILGTLASWWVWMFTEIFIRGTLVFHAGQYGQFEFAESPPWWLIPLWWGTMGVGMWSVSRRVRATTSSP